MPIRHEPAGRKPMVTAARYALNPVEFPPFGAEISERDAGFAAVPVPAKILFSPLYFFSSQGILLEYNSFFSEHFILRNSMSHQAMNEPAEWSLPLFGGHTS
jgi:hypothetical protein